MKMNQTPKSSNRDVHELRYRISQLEHLIINSSLNASNTNNINLNNSSLPSNSTTLSTQDGLIGRINELEGLLAASELENENLRKHMELLTVEKNRQEVRLLENVYEKDNEIKDLQHSQKLLEVKYSKSQTKLESIQEYINQLPSQDELDDAQITIAKLQEANQLLEAQYSRLSTNFHALQQDKAGIEEAKNYAELRLEELKPLEEAQTSILKDFMAESSDLNSTSHFENDEKICEALIIQKAQILRSTKIIESLREKNLSLKSEKGQCIIKITNLESDVESLQEQLLSAQLNLEKMEDKWKSTIDLKSAVEGDNLDLKNRLEQLENYLKQREEHITNFMKLVTEIDLCVNEVDKLVELGRSIAVGEEPSVSALLGLDEDLEMHIRSFNISSESGSTSKTSNNYNSSNEENAIPSDAEWALDRMVKVRKIRKQLNELRNIAGDLYSDMLGGKVEGCKVQ